MKKIIIALVTFVLSFSIHAQNNQPIKIVVPLGAGGGLDVTARIIGRNLSEITKTPVIVENKPGGNAVLGAKSVLAEEADGRTLLFYAHHSYTLNNIFTDNKENVFEWEKELSPVSMMYPKPFVMLVNKNANINNVAELKERFKNKEVTFGSTGSGTPLHVYAEIFFQKNGIKSIHVPYKALPLAMNDTLNGTLDVIVAASATSHIKAGNLIPILVFSDKKDKEYLHVETLTGNMSEYSNLKIVYSFLVSKKTNNATKTTLVRDLELAIKKSLDELDQRSLINANEDVVLDEKKMKLIERNWISAVERIQNKK